KRVMSATGEISMKKETAASTTNKGPMMAQNHMTNQSKVQRSNLTIDGRGGLVEFVSIGMSLVRRTARSAAGSRGRTRHVAHHRTSRGQSGAAAGSAGLHSRPSRGTCFAPSHSHWPGCQDGPAFKVRSPTHSTEPSRANAMPVCGAYPA